MSTPTPALIGRDIFMRYTGGDGKSYVQFHRVWNADLFEAARRAESSKLALAEIEKTGKAGSHKAERITEEAFNSERNA